MHANGCMAASHGLDVHARGGFRKWKVWLYARKNAARPSHPHSLHGFNELAPAAPVHSCTRISCTRVRGSEGPGWHDAKAAKRRSKAVRAMFPLTGPSSHCFIPPWVLNRNASVGLILLPLLLLLRVIYSTVSPATQSQKKKKKKKSGLLTSELI